MSLVLPKTQWFVIDKTFLFQFIEVIVFCDTKYAVICYIQNTIAATSVKYFSFQFFPEESLLIPNTALYAIDQTILQRLSAIYFPQLNLHLSFVTHNTQLYAIDKTILQQFLVISIYCCFVFFVSNIFYNYRFWYLKLRRYKLLIKQYNAVTFVILLFL